VFFNTFQPAHILANQIKALEKKKFQLHVSLSPSPHPPPAADRVYYYNDPQLNGDPAHGCDAAQQAGVARILYNKQSC
jgi:hypothetical protein